MKIYLPHIHYTVKVKQRTGYRGNHTAKWLCERTDKDTSTLYIDMPVSQAETPTLAQGLVHVIQNICEDRHMVLSLEKEHMGYLMQYLMNRVLGYEYA